MLCYPFLDLHAAGIFPSNKELSPADSNTNPRQSGNKSGISIRHSEVESHEMHVELWKDVTNTGDEGKAVQTLAKILLYKEGRTFISSLAREDAEFCIEILDHVSRDPYPLSALAVSDCFVRASQSTTSTFQRNKLSSSH